MAFADFELFKSPKPSFPRFFTSESSDPAASGHDVF